MCSYGIHEITLDTGEDQDGKEEHDEHEDGAIEQPSPGKGTTAETTVFEGLEDRGQWVELQEIAVFFGCNTERINNGRGIHEELHTERHEIFQIVILRGQRRDDEAHRHGMKGQEDY